MRWRTGLSVLGVCVVCYSAATGCGPMLIGRIYLESDGGGGSGGSATANGSGGRSTGAGGGMDICNGTCYREEQGTNGPALVWIGQKEHAPTNTPRRAKGVPFVGGFEHLLAPSTCGPCTCGTLIHTCTLPTSLTAYDVPQCQAAQGQPFDAAPPWAGACDDSHPLSAPNNIQSLSVAAIDLVENCTPSPQPQPPQQQVENWAIAYEDAPKSGCGGGYLCAPSISEPDDPPEGFRLCMIQLNSGPDAICAGPVFTERYVYYQVVKDTRSCTACTCTPPAVKGTCTSVLSVYEDANTTCSGPTVFPGIPISSEKPACFDVSPSGKPLGSKSATVPQYVPAPGSPTCQPGGGVAQGQAEPAAASVFCCLPSKSNPLPDHPDHP